MRISYPVHEARNRPGQERVAGVILKNDRPTGEAMRLFQEHSGIVCVMQHITRVEERPDQRQADSSRALLKVDSEAPDPPCASNPGRGWIRASVRPPLALPVRWCDKAG